MKSIDRTGLPTVLILLLLSLPLIAAVYSLAGYSLVSSGTYAPDIAVTLETGTAGASEIGVNGTTANITVEASRNWYPNSYNILSGNWLNLSWDKRVKITIDKNDVDSALSNFPVLVYLSNSSGRNKDDVSCVFNEIGSNSKKIAITTSDGTTQCYVEVEKWDAANKKAWLWVKVPNISSLQDTVLYLYYDIDHADNTEYVGDTGSTAAQNVWDSNYKGVWHLKEDPTGTAPQMKDSTSNNNSGTSAGSMTSGDQVAGKIDGSLDFDGINDEITCGNAASLQITAALTIEAWAKPSSTGAIRGIVNKHSVTAPNNGYELYFRSDNHYRFAIGDPTQYYAASDSAYTDNDWHYIVGVKGTTNYLFMDGVQQASSFTQSITDSGTIFDIGRSYSNYNGYWWTGQIDEVRVSNVTRSAAWIKASYESGRDDLLDFGSEELSYHVSGTVPESVQALDSSYLIIRSAGSATTTSLCNPSGYNMLGSTTLVSGTTGNLVSNNGVYMTFRSYASATSAQTLYAHQETKTIGGANYYFLELNSANATGTTLSASAGSTGRKLMGKFVYQLTGVSSIPASVWTIYYQAYRGFGVVAHGDVDILIRMSNGTVRTTRATNVADSSGLTFSWSTLSGTYSWTAYTVVDQTDYLEIDYYIHVTTSSLGASVYLRIDDNTLAVSAQTRATNVMFPSEFTAEVEFSGTSNAYNWAQLVWTIDSAWTTGSVTVTIQVYNYKLGGYPTSGNGYDSYTSSSTANTDETRTQTITTNPSHFRDGSGNWKIKVKGVKTTTTQFDFKADWVEFKPTYYSEYTVSTEFLFSSMMSTPTQLNFTVVSEYDIADVSVTIQVWNYSSSAYVTSGEGYLTYTSTGTNVTEVLTINTNPQFYTSNGNAKIKVTGAYSTTTQFQQEMNQIKLTYEYDTYDYVLGVVSKKSYDQNIRLILYNDSNIGRLSNCTIWFRDTATSIQIEIVGGGIVLSSGNWYTLPASSMRYIVVYADESSSGTSVLYIRLEAVRGSSIVYTCLIKLTID